jgi:hypothetical protein
MIENKLKDIPIRQLRSGFKMACGKDLTGKKIPSINLIYFYIPTPMGFSKEPEEATPAVCQVSANRKEIHDELVRRHTATLPPKTPSHLTVKDIQEMKKQLLSCNFKDPYIYYGNSNWPWDSTPPVKVKKNGKHKPERSSTPESGA